jgi:hypothetical protein
MTDERLHQLLDDAARTYRVPPDPDFAAIWSDVEREVFDDHPRWRRPWSRSPSWRIFTLAIAASLVMGVSLGRVTARSRPATTAVAATPADTRAAGLPAGYDRAATELLGRTVMLLTSLPTEGPLGRADAHFTSQASELLTTTRLLLDSPAASDRRFKELLEDLELILAQIARLKTGRGAEEMELITDALQERDVVPRIRSAVARLSLGDN